ncbi:cobyrinic acid a,c-diamide synthase [Lachnospiraceae bacterium]|nr:cobyrinic acid a,c-diamide synthase [Lachnospiraceae bacterium]
MILNNSRILISACASGSGKTTVTCGLLKALKNRNIRVSSCKCGPDYIDPMFHKRVIGVPSVNLDPFFEDEKMMRGLYARHASGYDINIIEGVMGYYDGLGFDRTDASTYEVSKNLKAPVILVVNAKGMAMTLIAFLKGIIDFRADSNIRGVILNQVSEMTYRSFAPVIEAELGIAPLGYLPPSPDTAVESRYLGLMTPDVIEDIGEKIEKLGELAEKCLDIDRIIGIAGEAESIEYEEIKTNFCIGADSKKLRIAVAEDEAFSFYYEDNLELLREYGCELIPFSPLSDSNLPENIDGLLLGGGYPELYGKQLSENRSMLTDIREKLDAGLPCLAECGGFMYLHEWMEDAEQKSYEMVGFLRGQTCVKRDRLVRFGYITLFPKGEDTLLQTEESIKAHEFHYWDSTDNGSCMRAVKPSGKREWECMQRIKNTICGYPHLFYHSEPKFAERFTEMCRARAIERQES